MWVAPLEFRDVIKWLTRHTSPGVIIVSAQKPDQGAQLLHTDPMTYIPSAFLNDNLARHVYFSYGNRVLLETTLQLDDQRKPWYVCTLGRPAIGDGGMVVTDAVIVDPTTGAMTGFTYMNAVDGAMTYYPSVGGYFSSKAAENAVASNGLVRQSRLVKQSAKKA